MDHVFKIVDGYRWIQQPDGSWLTFARKNICPANVCFSRTIPIVAEKPLPGIEVAKRADNWLNALNL